MASQLPNVGGLPLSDLRLVLLGSVGAGKSVVAHSLLGRENWSDWGMCKKKQGELEGRSVTVVDTPGWNRESVKLTDDEIQKEIVHSVTLCPPGPHTLILVVPMKQLPDNERKSIQDHMELLSDRVWKHTLVLFFSESESVSQSLVDQAKKSARHLLEKCGDRHHVLCGSMSNHTQLLQKIKMMMREQSDEFFLPQVYYDLKQGYNLLPKDMEDKLHGNKTAKVPEQGMRKRRDSSVFDRPNMSTEKQEDERGHKKVDLEVVKEAVRESCMEAGMTIIGHYINPFLVINTVSLSGFVGIISGAQYGPLGASLGTMIGMGLGIVMSFAVKTAVNKLFPSLQQRYLPPVKEK